MAQGKLLERLPLTTKPSKLKIGRELNRGGYGVVYEGVFARQQVAVKGVHKLLLEAEGGENPLRNFCEECERLKELEHPHVIKFLGAFKDARLGPILVMERMKENLQEFLENHVNKLTIQEQIRISHEITQGVAFLHQLTPPMVHRDLNDKNVMFTFDGVVKIGDFGQSKLKLKLNLTTAQPGMVLYMPPEALKIEQAQYDESLDIFSLGVLMLQIGTQQQPLVNMVGIGIIPEVKRREKDLQRMSDLHPLKPFILLCLSDDRKKRPKATELEMVLPRLKETILQTMIAAEERFCRMERDVQTKEEITAAKLKMDRMINALKEKYQSNLKKKDEEIHILKRIIEERSQTKENLNKVGQVTDKSSKDPTISGTTTTEGDEAHLQSLQQQVETFAQLLSEKCSRVRALEIDNWELRQTYCVPDQQPSSLDLSSEENTGESEYSYAVSVRPVLTPPPMAGTALPPNHARYSTPHAAAEQQSQRHHAGYQQQPSPSLPTAAGDGEEHTYINVTRTARTEAFPGTYDTVPSQGGGGVTGKQRSHKPESIKTAQRPTLQTDEGVPATDKRGLFSRPDSLGVKGETDGAPRRCGCGQTFAGDQGRQFVRHTLTCPKGSPVGRPKTTMTPGRNVQSQYFAYK